MCFGGGSSASQEAANKQAAQDRVDADIAKRQEVEKRAKQKREDISDALTKREQTKGMRGGVGRRSLFGSGASGFMGRFDR
jgi:hypothetical protein